MNKRSGLLGNNVGGGAIKPTFNAATPTVTPIKPVVTEEPVKDEVKKEAKTINKPKTKKATKNQAANLKTSAETFARIKALKMVLGVPFDYSVIDYLVSDEVLNQVLDKESINKFNVLKDL